MLSGRRLDPSRYETLLVHGSLAPGEESAADWAAREGARTVHLPQLSPEISPLPDARALASLRALVRRFRPHIVHTHTAKAGFLGRSAALAAGSPRPKLVHTFHGHVLSAMGENLFVAVALVAAVVGWWSWTRSAWGRPAISLPVAWRRPLAVVLPVALVAYGVMRNIPHAPFDALAP